MTLRLTEFYTGPALLLKDENGESVPGKIPPYINDFSVTRGNKNTSTYEERSKIVNFKISKKEFLEAIKDEGKISDIKG